jgi:hypothetical protein
MPTKERRKIKGSSAYRALNLLHKKSSQKKIEKPLPGTRGEEQP